jgi:hypothetical protein
MMTATDARKWLWRALDESTEREAIRPILERLFLRNAEAIGEFLEAMFDARSGQWYARTLNTDEDQRDKALADLDDAVRAAQRALWLGGRNEAVHHWLALGRHVIKNAARMSAPRRGAGAPRLASPLISGLESAFDFKALLVREFGIDKPEAEMLVKNLFANVGRPQEADTP